MKVIVFGNQQICVDCLDILRKRKDIDILGVVGCPQPLDKVYHYPSIEKYCKRNNLPYYQPEKITKPFYTEMKKLKVDLCFSIYYRNIFPAYFLKLAPMGFINVHNSLLPENRGPVPTLWTLLNGNKKSGLTLHYINKGVDTGDIIAQISFKVPTTLTGYELNTFFIKKGVALFKQELSTILNGTNKREKQNHSQATYYGPFRQVMRVINWAEKNQLILNKVRAFTKPYLGATASIIDKEMVIWSAKASVKKNHTLTGPGKIVKVYPDLTFVVSSANGFIHITDYEILDVRKNQRKHFIKKGNRFNL